MMRRAAAVLIFVTLGGCASLPPPAAQRPAIVQPAMVTPPPTGRWLGEGIIEWIPSAVSAARPVIRGRFLIETAGRHAGVLAVATNGAVPMSDAWAIDTQGHCRSGMQLATRVNCMTPAVFPLPLPLETIGTANRVLWALPPSGWARASVVLPVPVSSHLKKLGAVLFRRPGWTVQWWLLRTQSAAVTPHANPIPTRW